MNERSTFGTLARASGILILSVTLAFLWLNEDFVPGHRLTALFKMLVVAGVFTALKVASDLRAWHSWSSITARLEIFATALPERQTYLPEDGPAELQRLARAMRAMAERVRQLVERANLESSRRETILACMAEGVLAVDKDLKVIFCNDAFAQAFNTRKPAAEGRIFYEVVREPALREVLERVVSSGIPENDQFQLPSAAGRWFEARALTLGEEPRRGAVIVLHDVTDIRQQEQVRKNFVADVSHELRTPLTAIRGYAETLLEGALEDLENNRKFVKTILSHAIRLNNIASDLLIISELDSDKQPETPPEPIPVSGVIESAFHTVENTATSRGIHLRQSACEDYSVMGYRFRLEQVLVNLLDNAVKFNRPDGEVVVECAPGADHKVRITVSDTGIGIPSEDLKRVFDRFYRVDRARSRPAGGTGLGLSIVKELVERMGGEVCVESQLGRGSKFTISLRAA